MNIKASEASYCQNLKWILPAGFIAGLAEIIWVSLYVTLTPLQGVEVAREITVSIFGGPVGGVFAPGIGLLIHFALSIAIALAFAALLWAPLMRRYGSVGVIGGAMAALTAQDDSGARIRMDQAGPRLPAIQHARTRSGESPVESHLRGGELEADARAGVERAMTKQGIGVCVSGTGTPVAGSCGLHHQIGVLVSANFRLPVIASSREHFCCPGS